MQYNYQIQTILFGIIIEHNNYYHDQIKHNILEILLEDTSNERCISSTL